MHFEHEVAALQMKWNCWYDLDVPEDYSVDQEPSST
jgi:hypothetical protein